MNRDEVMDEIKRIQEEFPQLIEHSADKKSNRNE